MIGTYAPILCERTIVMETVMTDEQGERETELILL